MTALLKTKKLLFPKPSMTAVEVYGFKEEKLLQSTVQGFRDTGESGIGYGQLILAPLVGRERRQCPTIRRWSLIVVF